MNLFVIAIPDLRGIIAIVIATIVSMAIGFVWYGPLFGKLWMELIRRDKNIKEKDFKEAIERRWPYPFHYSMFSSLFCHTFRAYYFWNLLNIEGLGITTSCEALCVATCLFFGIHFTAFHHDIWTGRTFTQSMIDKGNEFVITLVTSFIVFHIM